MVTSIVVDTVTSSLPVFLALGTGIVSLIGVALKWASSRTHPGRLLVLETKAAKTDAEVGGLIKTVQDHTSDIITAATVANQVVPGLATAATAHAQEIANLQKEIATLTAQIAQITALVPSTPSAVVEAPKPA